MARRRVLTPAEVEQAQAASSSAASAPARRSATVLGRLRVRRSAGENHTTAAPARSSGAPEVRTKSLAPPSERAVVRRPPPASAPPSPPTPSSVVPVEPETAPRRRRTRPLKAPRILRRDRPLRARRTTPTPEALSPSPSNRKAPKRVFHTSDAVRRAYEVTPAARERPKSQ